MAVWNEVVGGKMSGWAAEALHSYSGEEIQELSLALQY